MITKFTIGNTYKAKSTEYPDDTSDFLVIIRTDRYVTFKGKWDQVIKKKVIIFDNIERVLIRESYLITAIDKSI